MIQDVINELKSALDTTGVFKSVKHYDGEFGSEVKTKALFTESPAAVYSLTDITLDSRDDRENAYIATLDFTVFALFRDMTGKKLTEQYSIIENVIDNVVKKEFKVNRVSLILQDDGIVVWGLFIDKRVLYTVETT